MTDELRLKREELLLEEQSLELQQSLPHLYGWKFYKWSRAFFESTERQNFICAANQISKSSTQIRKAIHWATDRKIWKKLWPREPLQFWYLYPTFNVATIEFKKKWVPEFLPRGKMKDHPDYGWKPEWKNGLIVAVHFNTGVSIYFKTYSTDSQDLQTGSVDAEFLDEECPEDLMDELQMRLVAKGGYFHAVFTPTLGQEVWRRAFEERGKKLETFKGAFKLQVSMYDCLYYEDGTRSPWSNESIQFAINSCKSEAQVQRRIWGRFVSDDGLKYGSFDRTKNMGSPQPVVKGWTIYCGADPGSGGADGHPSAIAYIAVNPERTRGVVFKGWRGDDVVTTASDVVERVIAMNVGTEPASRVLYDFACKDFQTIAQSMGLDVEPAEKSHAIGEQVLNVLFRNKMLTVYDIPELEPLAIELTTLKSSTPKRNAKDDFCDALRYGVTKIDWDWSVLNQKAPTQEERIKSEVELRREWVSSETLETGTFEEEFDSWNELFQGNEGIW